MAEPQDKASDGGPDHTNAKSGSGSDDLKQRLDALDEALANKGRDSHPDAAKRDEEPTSGYAQAFKLSSEFIAGIVTGALIGYLIDLVAGTNPWGLIIFLLLGFVAGVLNVLRSAGVVAKPDERMK